MLWHLLALAEEAGAQVLANTFMIDSSKYHVHGTLTAAVKNVLDAVYVMDGHDRTYSHMRPVVLALFGGPLTPDVIDALCHAVRGMRGLVVPATFQVGGWRFADRSHGQ